LLPLDPARFKHVLVTGPLADSDSIVGDWVFPQPREHLITIAQGLQQVAPAGCAVTYFDCGKTVRATTDEAIAGAVRAATSADVVIVAVGDKTPRTDPTDRTAGENIDRSELDLPGRQLELVQKLAATGKPVIVVLCNGRPLGTPWIADHISAIVEGGEAGHQGGRAIAEVLFGQVNPSGRLPITFPRSAGHILTTYNHKPSLYHRNYVLGETAPLFEFGQGLSYTTFTYSALTVPDSVTPGQPVPVTVEVANTGSRVGDEIVLVYVQDLVSSVTTPVKALKAFTRVSLAPGEHRTVTLEIPFDHLSLIDRQMKRIVEPGDFEVTVGGLHRTFQVQTVR
jgi:beta-glucosidase